MTQFCRENSTHTSRDTIAKRRKSKACRRNLFFSKKFRDNPYLFRASYLTDDNASPNDDRQLHGRHSHCIFTSWARITWHSPNDSLSLSLFSLLLAATRLKTWSKNKRFKIRTIKYRYRDRETRTRNNFAGFFRSSFSPTRRAAKDIRTQEMRASRRLRVYYTRCLVLRVSPPRYSPLPNDRRMPGRVRDSMLRLALVLFTFHCPICASCLYFESFFNFFSCIPSMTNLQRMCVVSRCSRRKSIHASNNVWMKAKR